MRKKNKTLFLFLILNEIKKLSFPKKLYSLRNEIKEKNDFPRFRRSFLNPHIYLILSFPPRFLIEFTFWCVNNNSLTDKEREET
jgi:hypothetical protein